jgi:hypothetical protein
MAAALGQRRVGLVERLVILEDEVELGVSLLEYVHGLVQAGQSPVPSVAEFVVMVEFDHDDADVLKCAGVDQVWQHIQFTTLKKKEENHNKYNSHCHKDIE